MSYDIWNLEFSSSTFEVLGYEFARVDDYQSAVARLHRRATGIVHAGKIHEGSPERPGTMQVTYTARWVGTGAEPAARIHMPDACALIHDICLWWSLLGGAFVTVGQRREFEGATFYGMRKAGSDAQLLSVVTAAAQGVQDHEGAKDLGLFPGMFLLQESARTGVVTYETLFVSTLVDLLCSKARVPSWSDEESRVIQAAKEASITALAPFVQDGTAVARNVIEPAIGGLKRLGAPAAADKLMAFMSTTPALSALALDARVVESHARAFNQLRNAAVHYAGFPDKIAIDFTNGTKFVIRRKASFYTLALGAGIYARVFKDIALLHFLRTIGVQAPDVERPLDDMLANFFGTGVHNGQWWLSDAPRADVEFEREAP